MHRERETLKPAASRLLPARPPARPLLQSAKGNVMCCGKHKPQHITRQHALPIFHSHNPPETAHRLVRRCQRGQAGLARTMVRRCALGGALAAAAAALYMLVALAAVVAATTKPVACFQCRPLAAGVRRGWLGRPLFLTPENQAQVDAARRGGFRHSSTALQGAAAAGAELLGASKTTFASKEEYWEHLKSVGDLPQGFKVGTSWIAFTPQEANFPSLMNVTIIALDEPTDKFALALTRNAFPGAPIRVAKKRLDEPMIQAVVVNNKISNVCPGGGGGDGGVGDAERVCEAVAKTMGLASGSLVLPSSTGVIGWRLPVQAIVDVVPKVLGTLQSESIIPAAAGIITTDRYPKVRAAAVAGGRVVGIAKGAGMIEPNLATMLVYILTDLAVPREVLRGWLPEVVGGSFNCISVDSDQSTSDTVALISSGKVPIAEADYPQAKAALAAIARRLAEDVVRNGEGTNHVMEVTVRNAPSLELARALGRHVVNSPLLKCAVAGNDPNVGRLAAAVGSYVGNHEVGISLDQCRLLMGGQVVFKGGAFDLNPDKEAFLVEHMKSAQLEPGPLSMTSGAHITFPPHERNVQIDVDLGQPNGVSVTVFGSDLTYAYVTENADYRS